MPARAPEADTQDHHRERRGRVESGHPSTGANVTSTGRLMLAVRGGRDLARNRTAEGRNRAKLEGKHMGRPLPHTGTAETGHQTARVRRYVAGVG